MTSTLLNPRSILTSHFNQPIKSISHSWSFLFNYFLAFLLSHWSFLIIFFLCFPNLLKVRAIWTSLLYLYLVTLSSLEILNTIYTPIISPDPHIHSSNHLLHIYITFSMFETELLISPQTASPTAFPISGVMKLHPSVYSDKPESFFATGIFISDYTESVYCFRL